MAKPKLNATLIDRIRTRRAQGVQMQELAREFGLGLATISKALKVVPAPTPAPAPSEQCSSLPGDGVDAVPTREELLGYLSAQAKALRDDVAKATDAPTRAAANRNLIAVQALITKLVPAPAQPDGFFVTAAEFDEARSKCTSRLDALVAEQEAEIATWPKCRTCGQPIEPKE